MAKTTATKQTDTRTPVDVKTQTEVGTGDMRLILLDPEVIEYSKKDNTARAFDPIVTDYQMLKAAIVEAGRIEGKVGKINEPVAVRLVNGVYKVERGNQRVQIAKQLNERATKTTKMLVPCFVETGATDPGSIIIRQAQENIRTRTSAVDKAMSAKALVEYFDGSTPERKAKTTEEIARILGVTVQMISQYLTVVNTLSRAELKELHADEMPFRDAVKIARQKDAAKRKEIADKARAEKEAAKAARMLALEKELKAAASPEEKKKLQEQIEKAGRRASSAVVEKATKEERKKIEKSGVAVKGRKTKEQPEPEKKVPVKSKYKFDSVGSLIDNLMDEYVAEAHGKFASDIAKAFNRYAQFGFLEQLTEELDEIKSKAENGKYKQ